MKNVIIVSPCSFTKQGFYKLTTYISFNEVNIHECYNYKDIILYLEKNSLPNIKNIILIDLSTRYRSIVVKQLALILNLKILSNYNEMLRNTPCIIFGEKFESNIHNMKWIMYKSSPVSIIEHIINAFKNPDKYIFRNEGGGNLSPKKKELLYKFFHGNNVNCIADVIGTHPRNVYSHRRELMLELGLISGNEFPLLGSELIY